MRRLLTRSVLQELLRNEPARLDLNSPEQCYFYIWRKFQCDGCGREENYEDAARKGEISQAAEKAKADGWYVPPLTDSGNLDCSAFCPICAKVEKQRAAWAVTSQRTGQGVEAKP